MKKNCYALKRKQNEEKNKRDDEKTTAAVYGDEEGLVVLSCVDDHSDLVDSRVEWIVDSAASYHATPRKEIFTTYKAGATKLETLVR